MPRAILITGSNLGNKAEYLRQAEALISERAGGICGRSEIIESEPWGFVSPEQFLNQVLIVETAHGPERLLEILLEIEKDLGRVRPEGGLHPKGKVSSQDGVLTGAASRNRSIDPGNEVRPEGGICSRDELRPDSGISEGSEVGSQAKFTANDRKVYSSRTLDIDILFYEDIIMNTDKLRLPHPRLRERHFVLEPLAGILPDFRDPVTGRTVEELLSDLNATTNENI